jgi:hypothetical protein
MESYCWPQSVAQVSSDERSESSIIQHTVGLYVSHDGAFTLQVCDGCVPDGSASVMFELEGTCTVQHTPPNASTHGCKWNCTMEIPLYSLRSSLYIVKVTSKVNPQLVSLAFFVVRATKKWKSSILCVLSTSTWNAYNDWGGRCLYAGATQVSLERPLAKGFLWKPKESPRKAEPPPGDQDAMSYNKWAWNHGFSVWSGSSGWWNWERRFCQWARARGFSVDFAVSEDLHTNQSLLDGYKLYVSVGHDEYWSLEMRNNVDSFRRSGGNCCVLSGNTCFWQVRYSVTDTDSLTAAAATSGIPVDENVKTMICYKYVADNDPVCNTVNERKVTSCWIDRRINHPETSTIGLSFAYGGYSRYGRGVPRGTAAFTVYRPKHWVFHGLDLCFGDSIGENDAVVAYEVDGIPFSFVNGLPIATMEEGGGAGEATILAIAPACLWSQTEQPTRYADEPGELEAVAMAKYGDKWRENLDKHSANHAVLAIFEKAPAYGVLINVGVTDWCYGLEQRGEIETITCNILSRLQL